LEQKGLKAEVNVLVGNPAEEIVRFVEEKGADLIIMASRGSSGFNRWDIGNVADKVIRATQAPVMLVKPGPGFKETKSHRKGTAT
jgi:nucleotide-binding universal stress UspA family protein